MTVGLWLQVAGIALQAVGIALAGSAFWRTFHEHGDDDRFLAWILRPLQAQFSELRDRLRMWATRLLRRRRDRVVVVGDVALSAEASIRARGYVGFGPLDTSDMTSALLELERRVADVNRRLARDRDRLEDDLERHGKSLTALSTRLDRQLAELRAQDRNTALSGLRRAVLGVVINAMGLVLVGAGVFWEAQLR